MANHSSGSNDAWNCQLAIQNNGCCSRCGESGCCDSAVAVCAAFEPRKRRGLVKKIALLSRHKFKYLLRIFIIM